MLRYAKLSVCVLLGALLITSTASATVVCTYEFNADPTAFNADVSSTDLINQGQSTYSSYVGVDEYGGTVGSTLNNGTAVEPFGFAHDPDGTTTETYTLNTSVNTLGYDIAKIVSLASYADPRTRQNYDVAVHNVGSASGVFTPLYSVVNVGIDPDQWPAANLVTIVDDGGASMATGVDQIRFSFHATNGDYNWSVYKEIDVFGAATTIPEPGTLVLLLTGLIGLLAYAWRKRR